MNCDYSKGNDDDNNEGNLIEFVDKILGKNRVV